ncbi:SymE family type I addiction module toxin [Alloalcanivorax gelatiniphagus]|uniref:Type I toxin-antitoxin system SymE family toxin n=1 Tax=Alloalcanivorax gelatiniphagus TaxID=1194167 RepID=A0ABY2XH84_9GAMM|nr:SymE family type I addiction module toxin [Alloalcanivorax gelatiniphagus]TMW11035.1 type I toxin-antitoxin system SymE family toxin [Alloalcanivorax gelatiniphagus]
MKYRTLKVRKGHRDYTLKSEPYSGNPITPFLLLKGTSLEQAGFTIDIPVSVAVDEGRLLIIRR